MELHVLGQGKDDPPQLNPTKPVWMLATGAMTVCVIERGMASGEPSVVVMASDEQGTAVIQTSLDKYLAGAISMTAIAETRWGWKKPEGFATIMPMEPEQRKALLEAIKKELEEWDD